MPFDPSKDYYQDVISRYDDSLKSILSGIHKGSVDLSLRAGIMQAIFSHVFEIAPCDFGQGTLRKELASRDGVVYLGQPGVTRVELSDPVTGQPVKGDWSELFSPQIVRVSLPDGARVRAVIDYDFPFPFELIMRATEALKRNLLRPAPVLAGIRQYLATAGPYTVQALFTPEASRGDLLTEDDRAYLRGLIVRPPARSIPLAPRAKTGR